MALNVTPGGPVQGSPASLTWEWPWRLVEMQGQFSQFVALAPEAALATTLSGHSVACDPELVEGRLLICCRS